MRELIGTLLHSLSLHSHFKIISVKFHFIKIYSLSLFKIWFWFKNGFNSFHVLLEERLNLWNRCGWYSCWSLKHRSGWILLMKFLLWLIILGLFLCLIFSGSFSVRLYAFTFFWTVCYKILAASAYHWFHARWVVWWVWAIWRLPRRLTPILRLSIYSRRLF